MFLSQIKFCPVKWTGVLSASCPSTDNLVLAGHTQRFIEVYLELFIKLQMNIMGDTILGRLYYPYLSVVSTQAWLQWQP